jgi:TonB family protein
MTGKKKKISQAVIWLLSTVMALVFVGVGFFIIKALILDDGTKRKRQIQMVTLLKPPPPPEIEERPPEPEIKEKEEILEPETLDLPDENSNDSETSTEPGDNLGLDSEGVAGSDGFGLISKKGGIPLIGSDFGNSDLLRRFSWYTQMIQDQIREFIQKELEKEGGIPEGTLEATVRIVIDEEGKITAFNIVGSSGSHNMDSAISIAMKLVDMDRPPPEGMPRTLKIRVSSKG